MRSDRGYRGVQLAAIALTAFLSTITAVSAQANPGRESIQKVVDQICSDGGEWLKCYSLEPSRCQSVTTGFVEPCVRKVMGSRVEEPEANTVARLLVCFNQEFMAKYGFGEVKSPECKDPMKHLSHNQ